MFSSFKRSDIRITAILMCSLMLFIFVDVAISQDQSEKNMAGNYSGSVFLENGAKKVDVGLSVTALKGNEYEAVLYFGGLPGKQDATSNEQRTVDLHGSYTDFTLRLKGDFPLVFQFIHNRFTALDAENSYKGHLKKIIRVDAGSSSN